jgi:hypothetical protein
MHIFEDDKTYEFLFDDRYDVGFGNEGDLFEDGDAYSLEDLLQLVKQRQNENDDETPETILSSTPFTCDEDALIWGLSILCVSPLGRSIAFDARFEDWSLEVDDIVDGHPIINSQLRILILPRGTPSAATLSKSIHDRHQFLISLSRGLRMIWQDMNNVRSRIDLTADDQIFFERLRRADMDVIALRIMWDLKQGGYSNLWRSMIAGNVGEVAMAANHFWEQDEFPAGLAQTFLTWMGCDHLLAECDNRTLDDMDARLQKSINDVCGIDMLNGDDVLNLSRLPEGCSYLAPLARTLSYSTEFRHIPDPVNDAHLRQILEECSEIISPSLIFRDSELERKIFPDRIIDTLA